MPSLFLPFLYNQTNQFVLSSKLELQYFAIIIGKEHAWIFHRKLSGTNALVPLFCMCDDRRGEKHPIWWFLVKENIEDFKPAIILFPYMKSNPVNPRKTG